MSEEKADEKTEERNIEAKKAVNCDSFLCGARDAVPTFLVALKTKSLGWTLFGGMLTVALIRLLV